MHDEDEIPEPLLEIVRQLPTAPLVPLSRALEAEYEARGLA